ncbi:MAG: hypothetical protein NTZ33_07680 [Bacteroidetes bacterium]|nr:hypothetical protein [Bacteroidota bacterium]
MKKLIIISFILFSAICNAQTEKGKILLSGNTTASVSHYDKGYSVTNFNFGSGIGVFIFKDLVFGLSGNFQSLTVSTSYGNSKQSIFELAPFFRCYIDTKSLTLKPYFEFGGGVMGNNNKMGSFFTGSLGLAVFLNHHVSLEPSVEILYSRWESAYSSATTYGFNMGISVYLGKDK